MSRVSVRYIIDDVPAAIRFYTEHLGFTVEHDASPAFASVERDGVRLLLSGDGSSGKRPLADGRRPMPGGRETARGGRIERAKIVARGQSNGHRQSPIAFDRRDDYNGCASLSARNFMRLAVSLSLLLACTGALLAGTQQSYFRSGTDTVSVYATVVDKDGRLALDLKQDDFVVLDEGQPQSVSVFANELQPIAIVLMIDRSDSIRERFEVTRDAAAEFVSYLLPDDRARIGSFNQTTRLSPESFTTDREELRRILRDDLLPTGSLTLLWNATSTAMDALNEQQGRRVLLLFTDGQDTADPGRSVPFEHVRRRAEVEDVMVYGVGLVNEKCVSLRPPAGGIRFQGRRRGGPAGGPGTQGPLTPRPGMPRILPPLGGVPPWSLPDQPVNESDRACSKTQPDPNLRTLADVSGGGYFELDKPKNLAGTFARIAAELHHQYALAYPMPTRDGKLHHVDVQVKKPGMTVRARRSYVAPGP